MAPKTKTSKKSAAALASVPELVMPEEPTTENDAPLTDTTETTPDASVEGNETPEEPVQDPSQVAFAALETKLASITALVKEASASLKALRKENDKLCKVVAKLERKKSHSRTTPSGFSKPTKLSDEACEFFDLAQGTELSRTDVTRKINTYVKENGLLDPNNRRIILPDDKLKALLGVDDETVSQGQLSFFSLQKFIKGCFAAKAPEAEAVAA